MRAQAAWLELNASRLFLAVTAHASLIITGACCGRGGIVNIRYRWMHDQIERTHNLIMHHCIGPGTMVRTIHEGRSRQDYLKRPLRRLCVRFPLATVQNNRHRLVNASHNEDRRDYTIYYGVSAHGWCERQLRFRRFDSFKYHHMWAWSASSLL
ncbi:hypothetical protein C8Q70DRAFT_253249 [Cubamyces menziesii]|nr:hypothetical protein C8Q70DRAFT_253249 [Cubamyces menziesii]